MSLRTLAALVFASAALALGPPPAAAQGFWFTTENDLLTDRRPGDDLYTFSVALDLARGPWTLSLGEDAFTDRDAGVRFDESYVTAGRTFELPDAWYLHAGVGGVHVGRGLLGEGTQNVVHRLIGGEEVELRYRGSSAHARLAAQAGRWTVLGDRFALGPRLELDAALGLKRHVELGLQALWTPAERIGVEVELGARHDRASIVPLEAHLDGWGAVARVGLVLDGKYLLSWSYNEQGDEREHLSVGYLVPLEGRREGNW